MEDLSDAGALDVFFDVDFAFAADQQGDLAFSQALEAAQSSVYLPAFVQPETLVASGPMHINLPYGPFRDRSWLASVNLGASETGQIRTYPMGTDIAGQFIPSAGAILAGRYATEPPEFMLNFATVPSTIPTVSVIDVIDGTVSAEFFEGRSVVVGATAVELGDLFSVPVHGILPGPFLHVFAAETLSQGRSLIYVPPERVAVAMGLLLALIRIVLRGRPWRLLAALFACLTLTELLALIAFRMADIALPTGALYPASALFGLAQLATLLDRMSGLLRRKDTVLDNTHRLLEHLFQNGSDGILILGANGQLLLSSPAATAMFGLSDQGSPRVPTAVLVAAQDAMTSKQPREPGVQDIFSVDIPILDSYRTIEFTVTPSYLKDTSAVKGASRMQKIAAISARDVTVIRETERKVAYLSTHDELTGALRRGAYLRELQRALESGGAIATFALNLKRFKTVNATLGRKVGDAVLAEAVVRLRSFEPELSAIVRLDGDALGFFVKEPRDETCAADFAVRVQSLLSAPYDVVDVNAQVGIRVGYAISSPDLGLCAELAQLHAEEALDAANHVSATSPYDPEISRTMQRARDIERHLTKALEAEEFSLSYQPQVRLSDNAIVGVEALLRWDSAELGRISPAEFVEVAEASGFINMLGAWVLERAVSDALLLPETVEMAVNVSAMQLQSRDFIVHVKNALAKHGLNPARLCLEVTETVLLTDTKPTIEMMRDISRFGVSWALDDFGTGYSSFAYLSDMPLSKLKLDRAFVTDLGRDPNAITILRSVRQLCEGLGIDLLCEGVETEEQTDALRRERCELVQGFLYGRPEPIEKIVEICSFEPAQSNIASVR